MSSLWLFALMVLPLLSNAADCPEYYWSANVRVLCYSKPVVQASIILLGDMDDEYLHTVYNITDDDGRAFVHGVFRSQNSDCSGQPQAHIDVYRAPCNQPWMHLRQYRFTDKPPTQGQTPLYDFEWDMSEQHGYDRWNGTHKIGKHERLA